MKRIVIAIEGINSIGKTEVLGRLQELLQPPRSTYTFWFGHEQQDGVGAQFLQLLRRGHDPSPAALALMFAAGRIDSYRNRCADQPPGTVLVYDRFLWSSLAYHSIKCDPMWVQGINQEGPRADLNILLDADPVALVTREQNSKFVNTFPRDLEYQQTIRQNFLDLVKQNPGRACVVDAAQDPIAVAAVAANEIRSFLTKGRI